MDRGDAQRAIIKEWRKLPAVERQTRTQPILFAAKVKDKYPFEYTGDIGREIVGTNIDYQTLMAAPLRE
jgi:hypothetical protein